MGNQVNLEMDSVNPEPARMARERRTIEAMVTMYCHGVHGSNGHLCDGCQELLDYAAMRLGKCPYQDGKTTCARCPVHCYRPDMRERVRVVMRYSGPRMLARHPVMAVQHLIDGWRKTPARK
jgi:predicted amidophosphoribosyltransferase